MTAQVTCRACRNPVAWWDHRLLTVDGGQHILNGAIDDHRCGTGPVRCRRCGNVVAAGHDLAAHLIAAAAANHRRYCGRPS